MPKKKRRKLSATDLSWLDWTRSGSSITGTIRASRRQEPIYRGKRRDAVVERVIALMDTYTQSKFQFEAACRHGIRRALILDGYGWARSDAEAAGVVAAALRRMGAVRPSWIEGQRAYTTPRENCSWCGVKLDDDDISRNRRFCSVVCAKAAIQYRDFETSYMFDQVGASAGYMIALANAKPRQCEACGKTFHTRDPHQKYCSTACAGVGRSYLKDKTCPTCGTVFHPKYASRVYCSSACSVAGREAALPERQCASCGANFQPKSVSALYCSDTCKGRANRAQRAARKAAPEPRDCLHCGVPFLPEDPKTKYCSVQCRRAANKRREREKARKAA